MLVESGGQEFRVLGKWFVSTPHCQCPWLEGWAPQLQAAAALGMLLRSHFRWSLLAVTETLAGVASQDIQMWPHVLAWASSQHDGWFPEHLWREPGRSHVSVSQLAPRLDVWLPQHYLWRKSQRPARLEGKKKDFTSWWGYSGFWGGIWQ